MASIIHISIFNFHSLHFLVFICNCNCTTLILVIIDKSAYVSLLLMISLIIFLQQSNFNMFFKVINIILNVIQAYVKQDEPLFKGSNYDVESIILNYKKDLEAWDRHLSLMTKLNLEFRGTIKHQSDNKTTQITNIYSGKSVFYNWNQQKNDIDLLVWHCW